MKRYLVSYRLDGAQWNIELPATDFDDAKRRLSQLSIARLDGEIVATIPGSLGPFAALAVWLGNLFGKRL